MSEWVEEKDWSKVKVGDRVRVRRPREGAEFTVTRIEGFGGSDVALCSESLVIPNWRDERWDLYVARPTPELPTEPGLYSRHSDEPTGHEYDTDGLEFYYLNVRGNWCDVGWGAPNYGDGLTWLAPVPDTARQVLDMFREKWGGCEGGVGGALAEVAAEFGVTEP